MKRYALQALVALNLLLTLTLGFLWIGPGGQLRNVHWTPPQPIKPDFAGLLPPAQTPDAADMSRFVATLDRPLFSPNRRPAPPAPVAGAAVAPPPDPLANIQLTGVYGGPAGGGITATIDGKPRRVRLNEAIGAGWSITSIQNRSVTFARGDESRTLELAHARPALPGAPAATAANPASNNAAVVAAATSNADLALQQAQRQQDENREVLKRRNAIRASAGLPPISN